MLIRLNPGLKCKQCDKRMTLAKDKPGMLNLIVTEDEIIKNAKFECDVSCEYCMAHHVGIGFIRDGVFRGIYEYRIAGPADQEKITFGGY
jgi:sulfatase maturation enzyme AslB (radical SAM superfamily)